MITSTNNSQIKNLIQLQKKKKERDKQKVFIIEGIKMFEEAQKDNLIIKAYISETFINELKDKSALINNIEYEVLSEKVFNEVSDTISPQGIMAIVKQMSYSFEEISNTKKANIIILESLNDPGNLGTIIRTGEGSGITGIIMNQTTVDVYNPKVIRSTMGSIFRIPFIYVNNINESIKILKEKNIKIYAAHLKGTNFYDEEDYTESTGFLIGNEANGLTSEISQLADQYIKIPMEGKVESLNASIAASILMYEVSRQRRKK